MGDLVLPSSAPRQDRQDRQFGTAAGRGTGEIGGLAPRQGAALARSEVWYREQEKCWQNRAVWYLFVAKSQVWYPPLGKSRGLVPAKASRANRDQAFLQVSGTKSPKLAEIGVPNLEFRQNSGWKPNVGYQTANYGSIPAMTCSLCRALSYSGALTIASSQPWRRLNSPDFAP